MWRKIGLMVGAIEIGAIISLCCAMLTNFGIYYYLTGLALLGLSGWGVRKLIYQEEGWFQW